MYQKFIINQDGVLKFGNVYLHRYLLDKGERCPYGGGLWKIDEKRGAILLYGRSFDFGRPDFDFLRSVDWSFLGGNEHPLLICHIGPTKQKWCQWWWLICLNNNKT